MENNYSTYNPNDIESLLHSKSFEELSESEKNFALENVSSATEYNELRSTLLNVKSSFIAEEELIPDHSIQDSLITEFNRVHSQKSGSSVWENLKSKLFPSGKNILFSPGFQLAGVAVLVFTIGFVILNQNTNKQELALAENDKQPVEDIRPAGDVIKDGESTPIERETDENAITVEESNHVKLNDESMNLGELERVEDRKAVEEKSVVDDLSVMAKTTNPAKEITLSENSAGTITTTKKEPTSIKDNEDLVVSENVKSDKRSEVATNKKEVVANKKKNKSTATVNDEPAVNLSSGVSSVDNAKGAYKETIGVSLGEKPELIELLFTTL